MRLKQIKLAGFKSFVDPTTVPFPDQMTAIVGPNGCGKSNIIDAVRWVLGESSAKNLRGDAMTDVIFNGSTQRKPISQASVELVFQNTEGKLQGSMANRSEISVKRLVTREAQSFYYLNGSKCRRRDITDIFLGTGLGPRSYAIIEQGMISRLIESKPKELRVFLDEAAGISKYKERRRETENRIRHTRENLDRLNDVREELGAQIKKLQSQAATASRYKELKAKERLLKSQLLALRWYGYNEQVNALNLQLKNQEAELEAIITEQKGGEADGIKYRQQQSDLKHKLEDLQQQFYRVGQDITRLEQKMVYARQLTQSLNDELRQLVEGADMTRQTISEEQESFDDLNEQVLELEPELELQQESLDELSEQLYEAESTELESADVLQQLQHQLAQVKEQLKVSQTRQQFQQTQLAKAQDAIVKTKSSLDEARGQDYRETLAVITTSLSEAKQQADSLEQQQSETEVKVSELQQQRDVLQQSAIEVSSMLEAAKAEHASLERLNASLSATDNAIPELNSVNCVPILSQLKVEHGWETAVESVLSNFQQGLVADEFPIFSPGNEPEKLALISGLIHEKPTNSLAEKIVSGVFPALLSHIGTTDTVETALLHFNSENSGRDVSQVPQDQQNVHEQGFTSFITKTGHWIGPNWWLKGVTSEASGFLERQQRIAELETVIEQYRQDKESNAAKLEQLQHALAEQSTVFKQLQQDVAQARKHLSSCELDKRLTEQKQEQQQQRLQQLTEQLTEHRAQEEEALMLTEELQIEQAELDETILEHEERVEQAQQSRADVTSRLQQKRMNLQNAQQVLHQKQMAQQALTGKVATAKATIERAKTHLAQLEEKQTTIKLQLQDDDNPQEEMAEELALLIEQREVLEQDKAQVADELADVDEFIRQLESGQHSVQTKIQLRQQEIQDTRLQAERFTIHANNMLEQLSDMKQSIKPVLEMMPEDAEEERWQRDLEKTTASISRLGAINLSAIEEFEAQSSRKQYLDEQNDDLMSAMETLELAIRKIDRETKAKFRETFENVNEGLQNLFPKVFGGGSAYLELTDNDLLETGVSIMARPPGKKNSTIHLLSGGEKALTALSLVFSIFRLNPAPFCMLDEVDAPLDDANVGRFCNLVREMSDTVQFVYISHNKVAMEMATHLTGVTMQEPGVSRMVAVDIEEAIKMAEA